MPRKPKTITLWTVACDDEHGTYAKVFLDEEAALDWLWKSVIKPHLDGDTLRTAKRRFKNDIYAAIEHYVKLWPSVSYNHEQHTLVTILT